MEEKMSKTRTISCSLDILSQKSISESKNLDDKSVVDDISIKIHNIINNSFNKLGEEFLIKIKEAICQEISEDEKVERIKSVGGFQFCNDTKVIEELKKIDYKNILNFDNFKYLFKLKVFFTFKFSKYELLLDEAEYYLTEYKDSLSKEDKGELLLIKANGNAKMGKINQAFVLYKEALEKVEKKSINEAWCYKGLSNLYDYSDIKYVECLYKAREAFLMNGEIKNYASVTMNIVKVTKNHEVNREKALNLIDELLHYFNDREDILNKEEKRFLLHEKGMLLFENKAYSEALSSVKDALDNTDNLIGNEKELIATINLGLIVAEKANDENAQIQLRKKKVEIEERIKDDLEYCERKKILNIIKAELYSDISSEEIESYSNDIQLAIYLMKGIDKNSSIEIRVENLENALSMCKKYFNNNIEFSELVYSTFAQFYLEIDEEKALKWYRKVLEINRLNKIAIQNYISILWKRNMWKESLVFFENLIDMFGENTSLLYGYGRSYFELKEYSRAIQYLWRASKEIEEAKKYHAKAMELSSGDIPIYIKKNLNVIKKDISIEDFESAIEDFIYFISSEKRMSFWRYNREDNKHKWISNPEQNAQNLLHIFLKSRFKSEMELFEECGIGAGRIDIFINFLNNLKFVIELKMCGGGYSFNYAEEGKKQLKHYLENKNLTLGYLIVFDGRIRDQGKGFVQNEFDGKFIYKTKVVNLCPVVKKYSFS